MATLTANLFLNTSGFTSGIEKAISATSNYHQQMSRAANSIKGLEGNINVLKLQAAGYDSLATSLKQTLAIEAQAEKLAQSGLITKEKAIALLREQQQLERNIATQKANTAATQAAANQKSALMSNPRAAGLPELPLTDAYLKQTERAAFVAQDARNKFNRLTGAMGNSSMGFLAFSQAVEDAQYGIKGVLNNIPQMILGFGGSMGLAGAISLAAVAAVSLYPKIKKLYGSLETERLKAAAKAWGEIFSKGIKAAQATYEAAKEAISLEKITAVIAQNYSRLYALGQDLGSVYSSNIDKLKEEIDIQEEIFEVRDKLLKLQGKKDDSTIEREKAERELKNLEDQVNQRKKEQKSYNTDQATSIERKENLKISMQMDSASFDEELKRLETNLAGAKANLGEADSNLKDLEKNDPKNLRDQYNQKRNIGLANEYISKTEKEIEGLKRDYNANKTGADETLKKLNDEINAIDKKNQASYVDQKRIEQLIQQKKELLNLNKQTQTAETTVKQDEYNKAYEAEMKVLKARAAGDEKELQRLEYKRQLQEELNELKKAGFVDDGKGTLMKRAKDRVDARINAEEPQQKAKANADGRIPQLGSVAKATNVLMGRSANSGILEENRRQTSLLRTIADRVKPTKETTQLPNNIVFA